MEDFARCFLMYNNTDTVKSILPFSCVCSIYHYTFFKKGGERNLLCHVCSLLFLSMMQELRIYASAHTQI